MLSVTSLTDIHVHVNVQLILHTNIKSTHANFKLINNLYYLAFVIASNFQYLTRNSFKPSTTAAGLNAKKEQEY